MEFVYLIHFDEPLPGGRQHYCGWTANLANRLHEHKYTRSGARIMQEVRAAQVKWDVVRIWWNGSKALEKKMKSTHSLKSFCPECTDNLAHAEVPAEYRADNI